MKNLKSIFLLSGACILSFFFLLYIGNVLSIGRYIGGERIIVKTIVDGKEFYQNVGAYQFRQLLQLLFDVCFILLPVVLVAVFYFKSCATYRQLNIGEIAASDDSRRLNHCLTSLLETGKDESSTLSRLGLETECRSALNNTISFKQAFLRKYICECNRESRKSGIDLACCAALSVVVSPKSFGDTLCMLFWNIRAINVVLRIYDLRPGILALLRIYGEVLFASFTVGSIEDIMDNCNPPGLGKTISFLSPLSQAVASVYSILRTISMTQYFICYGAKPEKRSEAKREAKHFALTNIKAIYNDKDFRDNMQKVLSQGLDFLSDTIKSVFWNKKGNTENGDSKELNIASFSDSSAIK